MSHVLQHLVMPNLAFGAPEEMYARLQNDKVHALMSEGRLLFDAGGRASFDTFFNSLTVGAWKSHTAVEDLELHLRGTGCFIVRLGMHRLGHAHRWLDEHIVNLMPDENTRINVDAWSKLESGMLYFAVEALEQGSLIAGHFATCTAPQREVKLGIVITHFNRKQWVLPAIERIRNELLNDPLYKDRIELVVVDNSQNITAEEAQGITLIPNKNLGGSGGFTRGLLHLKDRQDFTHCLFMDDDASCEIESIRRAHALLSFGVSKKFAIAGSLLRELEPFRLFEKGAKFDGYVKPLKSQLDMRSVHDLLHAEFEETQPDYGAWWFFCFPINKVTKYAFPFFVRGDDIRFGLENSFDIATLNGIGCWGDDFALKSGPLTAYLDVRSHLVQAMFNREGLIKTLKMLSRFMVSHLYSSNYGSARSVIKAIRDFSQGPEFFESNIDMQKILREITKFSAEEKMIPISRSNFKIDIVGLEESFLRKFLRHLSLNGYLIPSFMMKSGLVLQPKGFRASFRSVFLYKNILYEYEATGLGYLAEHNKRKFFMIGFAFLVEIANLASKFYRLRSRYIFMKPRMMSEEFWRAIYLK